MERVATAADPRASVWRGSEVPKASRCWRRLWVTAISSRHIWTRQAMINQILLDIIMGIVHCAAARANFSTRVVEPGAALEFCQRNDVSMWRCFCAFAQIEPEQPQDVRDTASMPLVLGEVRGSKPAFWASWFDCMPLIRQRHPRVAEMLVAELSGEPATPFLQAASQCRVQLTGRMEFDPPSRDALAHKALVHRPGSLKTVNQEPFDGVGSREFARGR